MSQHQEQDTETVWVAKLYRSTQEKIYHTDEDCINLQRSNSIAAKDLGVLDDQMRECQLCANDAKNGRIEGKKECPYCNAMVGKLPSHLPTCDAT